MLKKLFSAQFCALLIIFTYLGLTPHPENSLPMFNDLLMHLSGYLVAAFSINIALPRLTHWHQASGLIGYSIAIEIAQEFSPPRTFSLADIAANSLGTCIGLGIVAIIFKQFPTLKNFLLNQH
jgi:VanZ family protein